MESSVKVGKLSRSAIYSAGIILGVLFSALINISIWIWGILIFFVTVYLLVKRHRRVIDLRSDLSKSVLILLFLFGGFRFAIDDLSFDEQDLAFYNDKQWQVIVSGKISSFVKSTDQKTEYILEVDYIEYPQDGLGKILVAGKVLIRGDKSLSVGTGDYLRVKGPMRTPGAGDNSSYQNYLAAQNVYSLISYSEVQEISSGATFQIKRLIEKIRIQANTNIRRLLPSQEASLMSGILLGMDEGMSAKLQEKFNKTGMTHIVAISGFNISIISLVLFVVFEHWFGRNWASFLSYLGIIIFVVFVGYGASVVRAGLMAVIILFAKQVGRKVDGIGLLAFSASLMIIWTPKIIWDIGFQLSFAATFGLIYFYEPIKVWLFTNLSINSEELAEAPMLKSFIDILILTIAAQITTIPIIIYHFSRYSLISIPANLLILPIQPLLLISGIIWLLISFVSYPVAVWLSPLVRLFPKYSIRIVGWIANWDIKSSYIPRISIEFIILYYLLLIYVPLKWDQIKLFFISHRKAVIVIPLLLATFLSWEIVLSKPDKKMEILIFDVGQGLGILLKTPEGRNILFDGGRSGNDIMDMLSAELPFNNSGLDMIIGTSEKFNHIAGLSDILPYYPPKVFAWFGVPEYSSSSKYLIADLKEQEIPIEHFLGDEIIDLGNQATMEFISSSDGTKIIIIEYGEFRSLIIGELGKNTDNNQLVGDINLLILSESKSGNTIDKSILYYLRPQAIALSVNLGEVENIPDLGFLDSLSAYSVFRTDQIGWVRIQTDGDQMWVSTEK